jgi:rod shape determining protein RodA
MRIRLRLPEIDLPLALAALGLVAIGLVTVYSATSIPGAHEGLWTKQLAWALVAIGAAALAAAVDYRVFDSLAWPLYGVAIVLLVLVFFMGSSAYGARRWLDLGPVKFQPSELAKVATVLVLARYFDHSKVRPDRTIHWMRAALIVAVPFGLVLKEPDLGTALTFPCILVAMLFWWGLPVRRLALGLVPGLYVVLLLATQSMLWSALLFVPVFAALVIANRPRIPALILLVLLNGGVMFAAPQLWNQLHDYQKRRIETFLNPGSDPYGAGYQIIQSRIAIGSGGVEGKGYLKGTQKALAFLPMRHTDFVYSVVGEEFGLIGSLTVVLLYVVLLVRGLRLAVVARNGFASLMTVGIVTALFYHIMVNMLMTIGWAPVTGLPLPLLSYGGTALIANGIEIGLLQSVALRRKEF